MKKVSFTESAVPLRVLIADGSPSVIEGITEMLSEYDDVEVVGYASKAIEALILVEKLHPDALLMDTDMSGETLAITLRLINQTPRPPQVLVLIPYASLALRKRCLDAGADFVFAKTTELDRVVDTLRSLAEKKQTAELKI